MKNIQKAQELRLEISSLMAQQQSAILNGKPRYANFLANCIRDAKRQLEGLR